VRSVARGSDAQVCCYVLCVYVYVYVYVCMCVYLSVCFVHLCGAECGKWEWRSGMLLRFMFIHVRVHVHVCVSVCMFCASVRCRVWQGGVTLRYVATFYVYTCTCACACVRICLYVLCICVIRVCNKGEWRSGMLLRFMCIRVRVHAHVCVSVCMFCASVWLECVARGSDAQGCCYASCVYMYVCMCMCAYLCMFCASVWLECVARGSDAQGCCYMFLCMRVYICAYVCVYNLQTFAF